MNKTIEYKIAEKIKEKGGRVFYVGGYVRDSLLNIKTKDIDIEVHNISYDDLIDTISELGEVVEHGSNFGILSLKKHNLDIALPRKEFNTGRGHKDFKIYTDPFIGTYKAAKRRDFTINALMKDVLTGEIIDHFNGLQDLENKIIRHIDDDSFVEDSLRVLRACQFASRFNFKIADETINLCSKMDISSLSKERIEEELKKALLLSNKPSIFFDYLRQMKQLNFWFKEINDLINVKQDPIYHPEGDVYTHTMIVLNEASKYLNEVSNPYSFMLLALCHDLGKTVSSFEDNGRIHAYNHENSGVEIASKLLKRFSNNKNVKKYITNMIKLHMKPNVCFRNNAKEKTTNAMFDEAIAPIDLIYFAMCDHISNETIDTRKQFLFERLNIYNELMKKPEVTGDDLIKAGLIPDERFKETLEFAHKLHLSGIDKDNALKQALSYHFKLK